MTLLNILQVELVGGAGHVFFAGLLPGDGHLGGALRLGDGAVHLLIVDRSHLGGVPYGPRDGEIPADGNGSQLWLCAQINFAQMFIRS